MGERQKKSSVLPRLSSVFFVFIFIPVLLFASDAQFPRVEIPQKKLFVGEKLIYKISYLKIPVGEAESEVKEITEIAGRKAYHIIVRARSFPALNFIYKVQDEHHSYIDVEGLYSLRYEKDLNEGPFHAKETITYDPENHKAYYIKGPRSARPPARGLSPRAGIPFASGSGDCKKPAAPETPGKPGASSAVNPNKPSPFEMMIPENIQDQLSCGYFFRTLAVQPESSVFIPVNAGKKNWSVEIKLHKVKRMKIKGIGEFEALETEPLMPFRGIFVKQGKLRGWVSLDERRIPLKMKVKIPILGHIVAELSHYEPGAGAGRT